MTERLEKVDYPWIIWCVTGVALLVRLYDLGAEGAWTDELWAVFRAERGVWYAIKSQAGRADPNWVYDGLLHFWMLAFGNTEFSTRILSVLLGTIAVYGIYKVGHLLFDRSTGLAAAVMLSLSVIHVDFSQQTRMYVFSSVLTLLSFYLFVKALPENGIWYQVAWFIVIPVSFYTHFFCALAVAAQSVYLLWQRKQIPKKVLQRFILCHIGILIGLIPIFDMLAQVSTVSSLTETYYGSWPAPTWRDVMTPFQEFAGSMALLVLYALLALLVTCYGFLKRNNMGERQPPQGIEGNRFVHRQRGLLLVVLWFVVPLLLFTPTFIVPSLHSVWRTRYLFGLFPAILLLIARAYCLLRSPWLKRGFATAFLIFSVMALVEQTATPNRQQTRQAFEFMEQRYVNGDQIVVYPHHYRDLVLPYYFRVGEDNTESLPELEPGAGEGARELYKGLLSRILFEQKREQSRTWFLFFLDHDESRDRNLSQVVSVVHDVAESDWLLEQEREYVSYTRVMRKPYTGAHVMLLAPRADKRAN